ncbi:MAG: glycosyltransferase [Oculatellaceae cyanobacterium Prado106]|jgi:GT2 family glycosyltransferase|nr:glycosyltransferase [Oculatellaceae cyanobacterium Prado106]
MPPTIATLIPTYRRPQDLHRCLVAVGRQRRVADEVLVVVRESDRETWEFLKSFEAQTSENQGLPLRVLTVVQPGVVAALNVGLAALTADIVAITDDDAAPHPDWLERIEARFLADEELGGLGGRDWRYDGDRLLQEGEAAIVGRIQWFGRLVGNHHIGVGDLRPVDLLKGVNMSFRRRAIAGLQFDTRLLGQGAQVHNELAFGLAVKRSGWRLMYDPAIAVDHYEGARVDEDRVGYFNSSSEAVLHSSYNEALILLEHFSLLQHWIYLVWSTLIGTRQTPGLLQAIRFTRTYGRMAWQRFLTTQKGKFMALGQIWRQGSDRPTHPSQPPLSTPSPLSQPKIR